MQNEIVPHSGEIHALGNRPEIISGGGFDVDNFENFHTSYVAFTGGSNAGGMSTPEICDPITHIYLEWSLTGKIQDDVITNLLATDYYRLNQIDSSHVTFNLLNFKFHLRERNSLDGTKCWSITGIDDYQGTTLSIPQATSRTSLCDTPFRDIVSRGTTRDLITAVRDIVLNLPTKTTEDLQAIVNIQTRECCKNSPSQVAYIHECLVRNLQVLIKFYWSVRKLMQVQISRPVTSTDTHPDLSSIRNAVQNAITATLDSRASPNNSPEARTTIALHQYQNTNNENTSKVAQNLSNFTQLSNEYLNVIDNLSTPSVKNEGFWGVVNNILISCGTLAFLGYLYMKHGSTISIKDLPAPLPGSLNMIYNPRAEELERRYLAKVQKQSTSRLNPMKWVPLLVSTGQVTLSIVQNVRSYLGLKSLKRLTDMLKKKQHEIDRLNSQNSDHTS